MFGVGTSPLEIAKYLHLLWMLIQLLKEGAVAGFAQFVQTYEDFFTEAKVLEQYAKDDLYIQRRLLATQRLLHDFFHSIEEFSPHLGEFRKRDWRSRFKTAMAKVKWATRSRQLEGLQSDLKQHLEHFMRLRVLTTGELRSTDQISIRINASSTGSASIPQEPDLGGHFIFETACRKRYRILFYEISSLEGLHQWLLRVFDQGHSGRKFIQDMCYVLKNTNTNKDILPSSPCPRPFRDIISADHRVEMSIVVSYENLPKRRGNCPKCKTRGKRWYRRAMEVTCSKYGLCIRFLGSNSTGPDPLTMAALDDIRANGIKQFFECQAAPVHSTSTAVEIERWLESKVIETRPCFEQPLHPVRNHGAPDPWVFRRVVVCSSQWPGDATWSNIERAEQSLLDTVSMLNFWITQIDAGHDLAFIRLGKWIGVKDWDPVIGDEDLLRWSARLYRNRQPSPDSTFTLRERFKTEGASEKHFQPPVVRLRCFLWLYADILSVEANILQACSATLDAFLYRMSLGLSPYLNTELSLLQYAGS
ncbi:hypothetical protein NCS56_00971000 [Fusarium sp. Ph1]|nr:hypothetical protein NCS56_00971000 [Fusarium sp. Ph1]